MSRLYIVTGAPGAGKSTVRADLVRLNTGPLVIADMDELLDDGRLLGIDLTDPRAEPLWPAYNALWLRITQLVRRSGASVLLLSPLTPAELPEADAWLHLDCADDVRRRRLELRGWSRGRIDEALQDAAELRRVVPASVRGDGTPDEVAGRILDWAGRH